MAFETDEIVEPPFECRLALDYGDYFACERRDWLPPLYKPGTCLVCDEPCDLRAPGTTVAYGPAWADKRGVPMEVHVGCASAPPLNTRFVQGLINRILAKTLMQTAWPGARRFTPPQDY